MANKQLGLKDDASQQDRDKILLEEGWIESEENEE